jgi:hypothetical protein
MTIRTRLERLEAKTGANVMANLPTIVFNIVSIEDDGSISSRPEIAHVPTGEGWVELKRNEDEAPEVFMERVKQCEAQQRL